MSKRKLPDNETLKKLYEIDKMHASHIGKMYGVGRGNVLIQLKKMGVKIRQQKGPDHHSWKGGKIIISGGYYGIWKPEHPSASKSGYVYEHTLVIEEKLGRIPIKGKEAIHHIDGDKLNNHPDNLYLCTHSKHLSLHRRIEQLIRPMMENGIIYFDFETGDYKLKK